MTPDTKKTIAFVVIGISLCALVIEAFVLVYAAQMNIETARRQAALQAELDARPAFNWHDGNQISFAMQPGQYYTVGEFTPDRDLRVRLRFATSQPVNVALVPVSLAPQIGNNPAQGFATLTQATCPYVGYLEGEAECVVYRPIDRPGDKLTFVVADTRSSSTMSTVASGVMAYLGAKDQFNAATAQNRVTATLSTFRCDKNCPILK